MAEQKGVGDCLAKKADDGTVLQLTKDYGIGIDCHSQFLQLSVIVKCGQDFVVFENEFLTDPISIDLAREWCVSTIRNKSDPPVQVDPEMLSYAIESTSTYHLPVIKRWGGSPEIVNPKLAGPAHRKTDKLDAIMLSRQNINGMWKPSFIISEDVWSLRSLLSQKTKFSNSATRHSNYINSTLLKFGVTLGREGSVTANKAVRAKIQDLISETPSKEILDLYPSGLPYDVKKIIEDEYSLYDFDKEKEKEYFSLAIKKTESMNWETKNGVLPGSEMIHLLTTVPGVGMDVAITWLSNIVTTRRFPNSKAVSAYCGLDPSLKISAQHVTSTVKRGGNVNLHKSLCFGASNIMGKHSEPFGIWGYKLYQVTGKWKKGTNAVARRMAIALYFVQSEGIQFDYSKYAIMEMPEVIDFSISDLIMINPEFHRYYTKLNEASIHSTQDLADRYHNGSLKKIKGLGKKLIYLVKEFIENQDRYTSLYTSFIQRKKSILDIVSKENVTVNELVNLDKHFKKYLKALSNANIVYVSDLVNMYYAGTIKDYPRLGVDFELLVEKYIDMKIREKGKVNENESSKQL